MSAELALPRMSVEEFLDWSEGQEDNFELEDGVVLAMAPERIGHSRAKGRAYRALSAAIAKAGVPCEAFVEGPGVRIDAGTSYQPDVVVQCGPPLDAHARMIDTPVVVVEILSPSTAYRDLGRKARNYFRVPSIQHYLIVDSDERLVIHHRRGDGGSVVTRDFGTGELRLEPPGLILAVDDLLGPEEPTAS